MTAVDKIRDECDELFLLIDRRLLTVPGQDPFNPLMVLGYNLRLMKDYTDEILSFAHEYDAPNMPAVNGFWSWVRVVNNFALKVLSSFTSHGIVATLQDQQLMRASLILIHALDLVIKIRVDLMAQSSAQQVPATPASGRKAAAPVSLSSPFESCFSEAILLYKTTMEDAEMGTKERISIWRTLMSLTADKPLLPVTEIVSIGSSLIHDKLLSSLPVIPYIPFLFSRSSVASKVRLLVTGCEWVVNAGQKKQIYRREDFNNKTYSVNYYKTNGSNERRTLVLYLRESWNECCRNLASDSGLPCIDVFSSFFSLVSFNDSLQQLIDVYAWIHSRVARKHLGFRPDRVILVGHGIAGSLAVSLCVLLNEVNQIRKGLPLPHSVIAVRSKFNYKLSLSPSSALTFLTCMNGRLVSSVHAQMQVFGMMDGSPAAAQGRRSSQSLRRKSLPGFDLASKSSFPLSSILMYSQQHLLERLNLLHSLQLSVTARVWQTLLTPLHSLRSAVWQERDKLPLDLCPEFTFPRTSAADPEQEYEEMFYECPKRVTEWDRRSRRFSVTESPEYLELNQTMKQYNEVTSSTLISPLFYPDLHELRDVRLHLVPSNFDAALDDSVTLCRRWSGFVQMHLIEENLMDQYFDHLSAGKMLSKTYVHKVLVDILNNE